ncbi:MAG: hypothetical protein AABY22_03745 [Nanoarchaeota archaeon]
MYLRKNGLGVENISKELLRRDINITKGAIGKWIYKGAKPFQQTIIKEIKPNSGLLNEGKSYILGVLSGDGYVTTSYRFGLNGFASKIAATTGPLIFGIISSLTGNQRIAIAAMAPYFIISFIIFYKIEDMPVLYNKND